MFGHFPLAAPSESAPLLLSGGNVSINDGLVEENKKTTIDDVFAVLAAKSRACFSGKPLPYTEIFQCFIDDNAKDPELLLELLEVFIQDRELPIDKKQYQSLLNVAVKMNQVELLNQVPDGLSRLLIEAVKDNAGFGKILMEYLGEGAKVSMDIVDEEGKSALHYALAMKSLSETVIEYLLDYAENVEAFKPLIREFLAVPATKDNKDAWVYLQYRFTTEYADTEEESMDSVASANDEPAEVIDAAVDAPLPSPLRDLSMFAAGHDEPVVGSEPKRMRLTLE